jgi:hypothetical protein
MTAWAQIVLMILFWVAGIIVNAVIVAKAIGHYQGRYEAEIEKHRDELREHKGKIEELNKELAKLGRVFAAWTGMA